MKRKGTERRPHSLLQQKESGKQTIEPKIKKTALLIALKRNRTRRGVAPCHCVGKRGNKKGDSPSLSLCWKRNNEGDSPSTSLCSKRMDEEGNSPSSLLHWKEWTRRDSPPHYSIGKE
jgi:hypothetical protein